MLVLGIFLFGAVTCFGKRWRRGGAKISSGCPMPVQAGPACTSANSLPCCSVSCYTWWEPWSGKARQFVVMLHFLLQNCFYNYWPSLPQECWPPQRAVLFHFCQQWVFSLCSCRKAFVSCLSSLLHAVSARQPATCLKASFPPLCPARPQHPSQLVLQTLIRGFGCRCSGPAPVSDHNVLCDKRVDTWTTASPSITLRPSLLCCLLL